jgi:cytochrome c oxidase subunit 2
VPGSVGEQRRVQKWLAGIAAAVVVVAAAFALAGCQSPDILRSEGSAGNEIVTLAKWIFGILAGVLITVWVILVFVIVTGKGRPEQEASQTKGNLRIEIIWTAIPAVIVTVLFILTVVITNRIDMPARGAQFTAIGRQWWWDFDYKDLGFKSPNEIYAPVGRRTSIDIESADVIHSFWVPQMGGKIDMIPGHVNHIHFVPLKTGEYLGECSEFCGVQHGKMRFLFVVVSPEEYTAWVEHQQQPAAKPTGAEAVAGERVISSVGCGSCHAIRGTTLKGTFGPDLTHFGSRKGIAAYTLRNTPENLLRWIQDPQGVKPECNMPNVPLPPDQQKQLVAYLEELR